MRTARGHRIHIAPPGHDHRTVDLVLPDDRVNLGVARKDLETCAADSRRVVHALGGGRDVAVETELLQLRLKSIYHDDTACFEIVDRTAGITSFANLRARSSTVCPFAG